MHYRVILPALAMLALAGCLESNSGPKTNTDLLTAHTWKVTSFNVSGPAVKPNPILTLDFRVGGMFILTALECTNRIGTWNFTDEGETTVRTTPGAPSEEDMETVWTILELTDTRLHLRAEESDKGIVTEVIAAPM